MYPVLFGLLPSFGVLVATGFLVGVFLWGRLLRRHGLDPERDPERASDIAVWILVGVIGGARLMYVGVETTRYLRADVTPAMAAYLDEGRVTAELSADERRAADRVYVGHGFLSDPLKILFIWQGGLVMYGGFAGAMLLGTWAARRRGFHPWNALDTGLVAGFVGQAIGRWGCLLVGDDYGSVVSERFRDLPFPLTIRVPSAEWLAANPKSLFETRLAGEVLWATQPWMSVNALLVALVAWMVLKRRTAFGQVAGVVLIHYSITRAIIEAFRGDEVRGVWFGGAVSTSQLIAVLGVLAGVALLATARRRPLPPQVRTQEASAA
jgi:phosphatidylglycerol:prolipoprotein diacylglycerol transferase